MISFCYPPVKGSRAGSRPLTSGARILSPPGIREYWRRQPVPRHLVTTARQEVPVSTHRVRSVLLVDDEAVVLGAVAQLFSRNGLSVTTETKARTAVEVCERERPGIVILDMEMPEADAPGRIAGARAGVRADDAGAVARALHAPKSSAGQLGAHHMMACCEAGETLANLGDTTALRAAVADVELAFASVQSQLEVHAATLRVA